MLSFSILVTSLIVLDNNTYNQCLQKGNTLPAVLLWKAVTPSGKDGERHKTAIYSVSLTLED